MKDKRPIINSEDSFKETLKFLKKYFADVKYVKTATSHLASRSQNYPATILFKNRGEQFSINWNYCNCTLYFGDITKAKKTTLQYSFTKMAFDDCYPIEEMNNANIVFWECEITDSHDDMPMKISPLRLPINHPRK